MSDRKPLESVRLPGGDIWYPRFTPMEGNVEKVEAPQAKTQEEKVKEALERAVGMACPWCEMEFEGKVSLQKHIVESHRTAVAGDEELNRKAAQGAVHRAKTAVKK